MGHYGDVDGYCSQFVENSKPRYISSLRHELADGDGFGVHQNFSRERAASDIKHRKKNVEEEKF